MIDGGPTAVNNNELKSLVFCLITMLLLLLLLLHMPLLLLLNHQNYTPNIPNVVLLNIICTIYIQYYSSNPSIIYMYLHTYTCIVCVYVCPT